MHTSARLAVHHVTKTYSHGGGVLRVLDSLTMRVDVGEFVAVLGPSGCGKSTLFEIICGLLPPDDGRIEVDGERPAQLVGHVAYMPQDDLLFPWRRCIDNIILPQIVRGVSKRDALAKARPWLGIFGLEGFEEAYPAQLSGGMRQRAALLRTFLAERRIVALDEPFAALDAYTRRQMQEWLANLRGELKHTILLITHDVDEALLLADRVVVLSQRPASVVADVRIDIRAPRSILAPDFIDLKGELLRYLEGRPAADRGLPRFGR